MTHARVIGRLMICVALMGWSTGATAQSATSGSIAGVVRDATGGVLPGVTVEAASPALIEKVRTVITDGQGQYKIVELRPGTYSVTFSLPGFGTLKREGIELTTGFTATVNADLHLGSVNETVTVNVASPVVDVQNVRQQNLLSREQLDTVPTSKTLTSFSALTLGTTGFLGQVDVGGTKMHNAMTFGVHGSEAWDLRQSVDGMNVNMNLNQGGGMMHTFRLNQASVHEVQLETGGMSAEAETGGVQVNVVPKDGGNTVSGYVTGEFANGALQSHNVSDQALDRGLVAAPELREVYQSYGGVGGPIRRDKLWFYASGGRSANSEYQANSYYNKTQHTLFYTPDLDRRGFISSYGTDGTVRVTWQATQKQKLTLMHSHQDNCVCNSGVSAIASPETANDSVYRPMFLSQGAWVYPATNRLLFEAGLSFVANYTPGRPQPEVSEDDISVLELSRGFRYGAHVAFGPSGRISNYQYNDLPVYSNALIQRVSAAYVTGSHALKMGLTVREGWDKLNTTIYQSLSYSFSNQVPVSITQYATPFQDEQRLRPNLGLYAQDQWTMQRLTLNLGLRFDYLRAYDPAGHYDGGRFVPAYDYPAVYDVPNWKDVSPRLGGAYDLFGNAKTAVKGYFGRYVIGHGVGIATAAHPTQAVVQFTDRTWNDVNGNYVPDCDLHNSAGNGECGALSNAQFGKPVVNSRFADDVLRGFGVRGYTWQGSVALQHELRPGAAVNVAYFRTWYGNIQVTDNVLVSPADFDPYCITAPVDSRLPGGGGYQVCDLYDITPAKFGQVFNETTQASNFGKRRQFYDGVDVAVNARFRRGALLAGGVNVGRTIFDNCAVVDFQQQFCKNGPPFQPQVKLNGSYPLPWNLQVSGVFQSLPGAPIAATYVASNAEVARSLGRPLAACGSRVPCVATATITILEPNTMFEDRLNMIDLRLTKIMNVGRIRVQGKFDVYNVFNTGTILGQNGRYGSAWLAPTAILGGRLFKFGGQIDF